MELSFNFVKYLNEFTTYIKDEPQISDIIFYEGLFGIIQSININEEVLSCYFFNYPHNYTINGDAIEINSCLILDKSFKKILDKYNISNINFYTIYNITCGYAANDVSYYDILYMSLYNISNLYLSISKDNILKSILFNFKHELIKRDKNTAIRYFKFDIFGKTQIWKVHRKNKSKMLGKQIRKKNKKEYHKIRNITYELLERIE